MTKRFSILLTAIFTALIFCSAGTLIAADQQVAPDNVEIQNKGYKKDKKGPVEFSHKKHSAEYKLACTDCHHVYKDGKNVWKEGDYVDKCSKCHDPKKKDGKIMKLQNAYHRNCKNCHKAEIKKGKKDAPYRKCNDCHSKK